ncbi:MAG: DUF308 domain-containing protein [Clostridiales bacterium]|nr:DUF308 domain-containing protein [Clostridiales bacterium]
MKKLKEIGVGIILALCELIMGILLLINPVGFTSGIIMIVGIILIIIGAANVIDYFRSTPQVGVIERKLSVGIFAIVGGMFCAINPQWFIVTFPVLTVIYGLGTFAAGVFKVEIAVNMLRLKMRHWIWAALGAALTLICAIAIICNPLSSTAALWIFIAVSLIVEAVIDFITAFFPSKKCTEETEKV